MHVIFLAHLTCATAEVYHISPLHLTCYKQEVKLKQLRKVGGRVAEIWK